MSIIRPEPPDPTSLLRSPPHSLEAEQSILGGLLLVNDAWDRVGDLLVAGDFYRHEHRLIYDVMATLISANKPADILTVRESLKSVRGGQDITLQYLNGLAQSVPNAANVRRYAEIVRERSIMRSIIAAGDAMAAAAFNPVQGQTAVQVLEQAQGRLAEIGDIGARGKSGFQCTEDLVVGLLDRIQDMHDQGGREITGAPTGFGRLDARMGGMEPGDLWVLAARPSMGKTALALNIAEHVALQSTGQAAVQVFSMEMGAQQLALRMVASLGRIQGQKLRRGTLTDYDWTSLSDATEKLRHASIFVDETPALSVGEIRARAKRKARECGGVGLIVIDYLQLMSAGNGNEENRATALGEISRGLKALAKELKCPVLALSQLNRSVETRNDKRPAMSDLRESGAIEQDADVIMFIYRDDYYNKQSREPGVAEIIIAKNRNGPTGTERLLWLAPMTKFDNLAADYQPPQEERATVPARREL